MRYDMRHMLLAITILLVTGLAASCSSTDQESVAASTERGATAVERDNARRETQEAV